MECQYFKDEEGNGGDCYKEQNGKSKFREDFNNWFCDHHYQKICVNIAGGSALNR